MPMEIFYSVIPGIMYIVYTYCKKNLCLFEHSRRTCLSDVKDLLFDRLIPVDMNEVKCIKLLLVITKGVKKV